MVNIHIAYHTHSIPGYQTVFYHTIPYTTIRCHVSHRSSDICDTSLQCIETGNRGIFYDGLPSTGAGLLGMFVQDWVIIWPLVMCPISNDFLSLTYLIVILWSSHIYVFFFVFNWNFTFFLGKLSQFAGVFPWPTLGLMWGNVNIQSPETLWWSPLFLVGVEGPCFVFWLGLTFQK